MNSANTEWIFHLFHVQIVSELCLTCNDGLSWDVDKGLDGARLAEQRLLIGRC